MRVDRFATTWHKCRVIRWEAGFVIAARLTDGVEMCALLKSKCIREVTDAPTP